MALIPAASKWIQHRSPTCLVLFLAMVSTALSPRTAAARTWHVPGDAATIQGGIDLAGPGDEVLVGPGSYPEHDIRMRSGVDLRSEMGAVETTIDAEQMGVGLICQELAQRVVIDGFTIQNGRAPDSGGQGDVSGGGVRCINTSLGLENCVITGCQAVVGYGGGVFAYMSALDIRGCRVEHCVAYSGGGISTWCWQGSDGADVSIVSCDVSYNRASGGGGGIDAMARSLAITGCTVFRNLVPFGDAGGISCTSPGLAIDGCLIAANETDVMGGGGGLVLYSCTGSVSSCTIAASSGTPPPQGMAVYLSSIRVDKLIIAFGSGAALTCGESNLTMECCDLFGNAGGDGLCGEDLGGNFSADPLFCYHDPEDYTIDENSPCLPGHNPDGVDCGLVGARDVGCGGPPVVGACCLSNGSCLVEQQEYCQAQHGTFQGDGTTCTPNPCPPTPTRPTTWGRIKAGFR